MGSFDMQTLLICQGTLFLRTSFPCYYRETAPHKKGVVRQLLKSNFVDFCTFREHISTHNTT